MSDLENKDKPGRERGRPRKADAPVVDWKAVDRLLVHGEKVTDPETGHQDLRFPSMAELGRRYGISKTRIWQWATSHKCLERRKESQVREQIRYDHIIASRRAEARAVETEEVVQVLDDYFLGFKKALAEGQVRFDSPADLDRLVRLKELLLGNADSRSELQGGLTLEQIQQRHRQAREQLDALTPELAGTQKNTLTGEEEGNGGAVH